MKNQYKGKMIVQIVSTTLLAMVFATSSRALVDPTRPPNYQNMNIKTQPIGSLKLTAIFYSQYNKSAIIDGRSYKAGDPVGEFIITKISHDQVELIGPKDKRETLTVAPIIKQEVRDGKH